MKHWIEGYLQKQAWLGVDLDGTLAKYYGFRGPTVIGNPIPEMIARVRRWLRDGKDVRIFTARVSGDNGSARKAIERWCDTHLGQKLPVTNAKDHECERIYDDRATTIERNTGKTK